MMLRFDTIALQARQITVRPMTSADLPFLCYVYASTRVEELAPVPWSAEQKVAFLTMQFEAQHAHYQEHNPGGDFLVIMERDTPIGRLYLNQEPAVLRLIDIALLPAYRQQGIGALLVAQVLAEARRLELPVRLYVEQNNPVLAWYQRLGFRKIGDTGVYLWMEWRPAGASQTHG